MSVLLRCFECDHRCERSEAAGTKDSPYCPRCWGPMIVTAASGGGVYVYPEDFVEVIDQRILQEVDCE